MRLKYPQHLQLAIVGAATLLVAGPRAKANGVLEYGNENVLGTATYPTDPKAGAILIGLGPNVVTDSPSYFGHSFPFSPAAGDFPGTDQIYVGSVQTADHDGYSVSPERINGPDVLSLDYSSLVPAGKTIQTLTLGIAADDFQFPIWGNPFTATINGTVDTALSNQLNSYNETGPLVNFFTIGIDPALLTSNNVLSVSIDEGGDGGDGYAIDFATVGVTTQAANATPEPGGLALLGAGTAGAAFLRRRRTR